jgi:ABC-type uncharacterized transport system substrate-binding protein
LEREEMPAQPSPCNQANTGVTEGNIFQQKTLQGAKSADLPVEPLKFELIINLKAARQIGLTIPQVLIRAYGVIR